MTELKRKWIQTVQLLSHETFLGWDDTKLWTLFLQFQMLVLHNNLWRHSCTIQIVLFVFLFFFPESHCTLSRNVMSCCYAMNWQIKTSIHAMQLTNGKRLRKPFNCKRETEAVECELHKGCIISYCDGTVTISNKGNISLSFCTSPMERAAIWRLARKYV